MNSRLFLPYIFSALLLTAPLSLDSRANAAGFALIEHSSSGIGTAFAGGAAIADEGSTVYFNPAGMSRLKRELQVGVHPIFPKIQFRNKGSKTAALIGGAALSGEDDNGDVPAVPVSLFYVMPVNDDLRLGFGFNVPFGLTTEYDKDWVGRYHGVKSEIMTFNFNPAFSYRFSDMLSIGAGFNAQRIDVTLESAIDVGSACPALTTSATCSALALVPQSSDGFVSLDADNWAYGWNAGILINVNKNTRVGLAYRSELDHDLNGTADFTVPAGAAAFTAKGLWVDSDAAASLKLPDTASLSIFHTYGNLSVMADVTWTGWSVFKELRIDFSGNGTTQPDSVTTENWEDSMKYALGISYDLQKNLVLRGGVAYDGTPIPDAEHRTVRVPDNSRTWLSLGAGFKASPSINIDVGYTHLFLGDSKINNTFESSVPTINHTITGEYEVSVEIVSAQARWVF